jgi:hypothetical protein
MVCNVLRMVMLPDFRRFANAKIPKQGKFFEISLLFRFL